MYRRHLNTKQFRENSESTLIWIKRLIQEPNPDLQQFRSFMINQSEIAIPDEIFVMARQKDLNIFHAMEEGRLISLRKLLGIPEGAPLGSTPAVYMSAFQRVLANDFGFISIQSLVDLISAYPTVVNAIMTIQKSRKKTQILDFDDEEESEQSTGNTLLHQLIIEKELDQIKAYMIAIFTVRCMPNNISFDIENRNSADKTALQLALDSGNKDIIVAILLYGNPSYTSFETQLASLNINIAEIMRQRTELMLKTIGEISQRLQVFSQVNLKTNINVGKLAWQQEVMGHRLTQLAQATTLNQAEKALKATGNLALHYEHQGLVTQPAVLTQPQVLPISFVCPAANGQQGNPAVFMEELKSIRETIAVLKSDVQQKSKLLETLEQRVSDIEMSLTTTGGLKVNQKDSTTKLPLNQLSTQ